MHVCTYIMDKFTRKKLKILLSENRIVVEGEKLNTQWLKLILGSKSTQSYLNISIKEIPTMKSSAS